MDLARRLGGEVVFEVVVDLLAPRHHLVLLLLVVKRFSLFFPLGCGHANDFEERVLGDVEATEPPRDEGREEGASGPGEVPIEPQFSPYERFADFGAFGFDYGPVSGHLVRERLQKGQPLLAAASRPGFFCLFIEHLHLVRYARKAAVGSFMFLLSLSADVSAGHVIYVD